MTLADSTILYNSNKSRKKGLMMICSVLKTVPWSELGPLTILCGTLQVCRMRVWEMLAESISCAGDRKPMLSSSQSHSHLKNSNDCYHSKHWIMLWMKASEERPDEGEQRGDPTHLPSCRRWSAGCYSDMEAWSSAGRLRHCSGQKWTDACESAWTTGPGAGQRELWRGAQDTCNLISPIQQTKL